MMRRPPRSTLFPYTTLSDLQLYHSIKEDIAHNVKIGNVKEYILYKLDMLDEYLKEQHTLFGGRHNIPTILHNLSTFNDKIQEKDNYTAEHAKRVASLSIEIGEKLKLSENELSLLEISALLHDIGKIKIPDSILKKKGVYSHEEYEIMMHHPIYSSEMIDNNLPLEHIKDIIISHHEKLDGSGYPHGWTHKEIPFLAKILTLADSYDAMMHDRVYRKALTEKQAKKELKRCSGIQFDKYLVSLLLS